ncbi:alpha-N-acetylgalactosaminide alpha-2,6-sialyltransferase 6-like isoform X2 [Haemaphysalis longicornis]
MGWRPCRRLLVPAVLWLACLLCTLQMLAGFASFDQSTGESEGASLVPRVRRLRPRHVGGDREVRGRTYQRHGAEPVDAQHRELHQERLRLNRLVRPHLVARRQIFSAPSSQGGAEASDFVGQEQPNVSCATCALVGYSGHLLGSGLGGSVDASDCVIRLGRSPGQGYDQDVGSKTTFRLLHADTLHDLLKRGRRPQRLASGPLASNYLVVFGTPRKATPASLRTRLESSGDGGPRLLNLRRSAEHAAAKSLAQHASTLGYDLSGAEPSTLWHAVRLTESIGCDSVDVFGVPEPKLCKRQQDEASRSLFWEYASRQQCVGGVDAGHNEDPLRPDPNQLSLLDRRALAGWIQGAGSRHVRFWAPSWDTAPPPVAPPLAIT